MFQGILTATNGIAFVIWSLVIATYWIHGFIPFEWKWPVDLFENGASIVATSGLRFSSPGIAHTNHPPKWVKTAIKQSRLVVSLDVRAARTYQVGPARILTLSEDPSYRNLTIGQQGMDLIVRLRHPRTGPNGTPAYLIDDVFATPGWHHIDVVVVAGSLTIRADEDQVLVDSLPPQPLAGWSDNYEFALGNELTGDRPWLGDIRKASVRVDGIEIDYAQRGGLEVPENFRVHSPLDYQLLPFIRNDIDIAAFQDWALNLVGFMPIGLLIVLQRRGRSSVLIATALCAALSATIEVGQLLLPLRVTSAEDLILNTFGGALGAWVGHVLVKFQQWHEQP